MKVKCNWAKHCDDTTCAHRLRHEVVRDPACDGVNSCRAYIECHGRNDGHKVRCVKETP